MFPSGGILSRLQPCCLALVQCRANSNRTAITRMHRVIYSKTYPTMLVQPDGSTITVRHKQPLRIIQLPVDLTKLSPEERLARIQARKPKTRIVIEDEFDDGYDAKSYQNMLRKR